MAGLHTPEDTISLLRDYERRSKQKAAGLGLEDSLDSAWTGIGFRVGAHHFVIPLGESREVFPLPEQITTVPQARPWVYGIVNLRGELLPVFDLGHFLFDKPVRLGKRSRVLVINDREIGSGVLVDEVFGLKHFQRQAEPFDATRHLNITSYLQGSVFQQDIQWDVFSFRKLIADPRFINAAA